MLDKLKTIENRYLETESRMASGELFTSPSAYTAAAKELKELEPTVAAYRDYKRALESMAEAEKLLSDPDLGGLAREEYQSAKAEASELEERLRIMLLPKDPDADKNVIMEIRGGVGGEESALFAHDLFRMYSMYAEKCGWKTEIVNINETELGGIKEIAFMVEGTGAYSRLRFEAGVHRVQRVPETESGGRIHTSAATVAVLPEADELDFKLDPSDLRIDTFRASGAGGQHVNRTESAIRITHIPTGTVVECQDERSQYKNKDRAMSILRSKLLEAERERRDSEIAAERRSQVRSGDRSDKVRTYNFPQSRVTDHRLTGDRRNFNIASVINGDLDPIIDALILEEQAEKLKNRGE